jgi:hypothetical protein
MENRILGKLRKYGPREFMVRSYRHFRRLASQRDRFEYGFDRRYNINTGMIVSVDELAFEDAQAQAQAKEHHPSPPYAVMAALKALSKHIGGVWRVGLCRLWLWCRSGDGNSRGSRL